MPKSGFVTIAGRPNVGKSTLLNRLVGGKVAITSPRPQTTRNRIVGVMSRPEFQIVFMDTPGVTTHRSGMERSMTDVSVKTCAEGDVTLFISDAEDVDEEYDVYVLKRLGAQSKKKLLAINKIDLVKKPRLLEIIGFFDGLGGFDQIIPISARTGENLDDLVSAITGALPEGPRYYPDDMVTDQPERFVIGEIIREKAFGALQQELPYSTAVSVEYIEERSERLMVIAADIIVERRSQKGIVVGKGGAMIKSIGQAARKELEIRLNSGIYLDLKVKVKPKWSRNFNVYKGFGYGSMD